QRGIALLERGIVAGRARRRDDATVEVGGVAKVVHREADESGHGCAAGSRKAAQLTELGGACQPHGSAANASFAVILLQRGKMRAGTDFHRAPFPVSIPATVHGVPVCVALPVSLPSFSRCA